MRVYVYLYSRVRAQYFMCERDRWWFFACNFVCAAAGGCFVTRSPPIWLQSLGGVGTCACICVSGMRAECNALRRACVSVCVWWNGMLYASVCVCAAEERQRETKEIKKESERRWHGRPIADLAHTFERARGHACVCTHCLSTHTRAHTHAHSHTRRVTNCWRWSGRLSIRLLAPPHAEKNVLAMCGAVFCCVSSAVAY